MPLDTSIPLQFGQTAPTQAINPMTIYQAMQDQRTNALREQMYQQEMAKNAMLMQNTEEDRRITAATRAEAARKAAEERRLQVEFMRDVQSGFTPAKNAIMGPGTIQGSTPAQFDPTAVKNRLLARGNVGGLKTYSDMLEQLAKQQEAEGKATGQGLTNKKIETETAGLNLKNVTDQLAQLNAGIERAVSPDEIDALFDGSADAIRATGKTPAMSKAAFRQLAERVGFDNAKMQVAQGITATQKHLSDTFKTLETPQGILEYQPGSGIGMPIQTPTGVAMPTDKRAVTNIDMKGEGAFTGELGKLEAADVMKSRTAAEEARGIIDTISEGRKLLDKGVISGTGADFKLGFAKLAKTTGIAGFDGKIENTESYAANMAKNVGSLIKQFGSGTGLSNADREYAEQMAGGKITLDENSMRKILDMSDRAARNVISKHNARVKDVKSQTGLTVEEPIKYFTHPDQVKAAKLPSGTHIMTPEGEKVVP